MKYRDLRLSFTIEGIQFTVISICLEKLPMLMPMHSHSKNSYEIHYISYGYGTLRANGNTYPITPGTLFVTGPEVEHEQISVPETPMTEYCIYLKISSPSHKAVHTNPLIRSFISHPFWFGSGDNATYELMNQIIRELEHPQEGYELVLQSLLQQVIIMLVRNYNVAVVPGKQHSPAASSPNDLAYLIIEEAFLYHYRDITLESLAAQLGLGIRQTERLLQIHYHKTFQAKKKEARMSAACSLLRGTDASVSSIAEELGYSSVEHFSNAFRRFHSMTPSQFRRHSKEAAM